MTYNGLAIELDLSPYQVHAAVRKAIKSGLAHQEYELLVIADALRAGRARENQAAAKELKKKLKNYD